MNLKLHIRPISICIFSHQGYILAGEGYDDVKQTAFLRPIGGEIHFGETSKQAMRREIDEEIGLAFHELRLLGVLENLFICEGEQGHEIVFVFDACLSDPKAYEQPFIPCIESNGQHFRALWCNPKTSEADALPLYPDGLAQLLSNELR